MVSPPFRQVPQFWQAAAHPLSYSKASPHDRVPITGSCIGFWMAWLLLAWLLLAWLLSEQLGEKSSFLRRLVGVTQGINIPFHIQLPIIYINFVDV